MPTTKIAVHDVVIIGAGFAGLGAGKRLAEAGVTDFVILDRGDTVGGTWRDNTYPGAACDIPSHLYSFSFDLNPDWSKGYPDQEEIHDYLRGVVDRHGLRSHLRANRQVERAAWQDDEACWEVVCDDGETFRATALVSAIGFLRDAKVPDLPGHDSYVGDVMHTAQWDHEVDLDGKRVGVVGTGASGIQVTPEIADVAASVTVFQRTPPYVMPRYNRGKPAVERWAMRHVPGLQRLARTGVYLQKESRFAFFVGGVGDRVRGLAEERARRHMESGIDDPALRRTVTPDYPMGCKRILISNDWYPTLARDHVAVTSAVASFTPSGIVDANGVEHELDVVVFATGFSVERPLGDLDITGRDGRDLDATWGVKPTAYLGASIPDFPNLFLVIGPNCGLGHNSMVFQAEAVLRHVVPGVQRTLRPDVRTVEVTREAHDAFVAEMDERSRSSVWEAGCTSWYLNSEGENALLWPGSTVEYWWRTRDFHDDAYVVEPAARAVPNPAVAAAG